VPELEELYSGIKDNLYAYIMKLSGNNHVAEEVVQETFCRALEQLLISNKELTTAWFYTVAKHLYFDYIKKQKKYKYTEDFDKEYQAHTHNLNSSQVDNLIPSLDYHLIKSDQAAAVKIVLSQLKDNYRKVLELREFKELSYEEISKITGMNLVQVKVTLYRARNKFKDLYKNQF
jgi:RNA polymerase sigma-70 factor, ECF subfamily